MRRGVRLADVLVALSLATDLGLGQPSEHMVRSTRIALRLGKRLGLSDPALQTLYDVSHAYLVERMFTRPEPLRRIGVLAATHHERMDGSGYHRGLAGALISAPARVLAAADAYHPMGQPRPHRSPLERPEASRRLRMEADAGRLDPVAVDAVLAASGQTRSRSRSGGPAGLTARATEVLGQLAQGLSNKAIARKLAISTKTAGNHIEHIYTKSASPAEPRRRSTPCSTALSPPPPPTRRPCRSQGSTTDTLVGSFFAVPVSPGAEQVVLDPRRGGRRRWNHSTDSRTTTASTAALLPWKALTAPTTAS